MSESGLAARRARPNALWRRPRRLEKMVDRARYLDWFEGKSFTSDWTSGNFTAWRRVLSPWRMDKLRILEIGSWEGRSAIFFLNYFPNSTIVCIDTFEGGADHGNQSGHNEKLAGLEARFDSNLAAHAARIEKIKDQSVPALERLARDGRRFDLAYIDGSHLRDDVLADSEGVWPLLDPGAVLIWDDYEWGRQMRPEERPQPAIDEFLAARPNAYRTLARTYQMIVEKL